MMLFRTLRCVLLVVLCVIPACLFAQGFRMEQPGPDNPVLARFDGGHISLRDLENFIGEISVMERVPRVVDAQVWRRDKCRDLARNILFTSQALEMKIMEDPAFLRSRHYFINEWMSYAVVRDHVVNKIDASVPKLREFYDAHKQDYYLSPTVSLRLIRTRSDDKATSALQRILAGEPFEKVETEMSEASLRQRGTILGPFPSTAPLSIIPPPQEVVKAAEQLDVGKTTGPLHVNNNYFIVQTAAKTVGEQKSFEDAIEFVETRVRLAQGDELTRKLLKQLREVLMVEENEAALNDKRVSSSDIIATVGALRMPKQEYEDLNGRVRGPALEASMLEPTPLRKFLVPYIFGEAGKLWNYTERAEFNSTLYHSDLLRLSQRALNRICDKITTQPSEQVIRKIYEDSISTDTAEAKRLREIPYDLQRESIRDALHQEQRGNIESQVVLDGLKAANFRVLDTPECTRMSGLEALVALTAQMKPGYELQMLSTLRNDKDASDTRMMVIPVTECGRRETWRAVCIKNDGGTTSLVELLVRGPHKIMDRSAAFTSNPLYMQWIRNWRFDTDALARHAYDNGMRDLFAKYSDNIHVNTRVEFVWDQGKPKECWIVFELRPIDSSAKEMLTMKYNAGKGELSRKPIRDCIPCEDKRKLLNEPF